MPERDRLITEQDKQIKDLQEQNIALERKMALMYYNWNYDSTRFKELKEKCKCRIEISRAAK